MIVAKTKLRRVPAGCGKCPYYKPGKIYAYFWEPGMCELLQHETTGVIVSRERLIECPLMEMGASGT